jgi:hypothetical protein
MVRTQIYLTERQRSALTAMSRTKRKGQSELIREAIDRLISQTDPQERELVLHKAAGIWKDRKDLPDYRAIRSDWDRD